MANDDNLAAWDDAFGEAEAPKIGANRELLRKALALNPGLRDQGMSSTKALDELVAATVGKSTAKAGGKQPAPASGPRTLTETVRDLKRELEEAKKAIAQERAALDQRERALKPAICERFIDAVLAIDPNMTSPKTAFLLNQEKVFLDGVGFNTQKLVERESRKK